MSRTLYHFTGEPYIRRIRIQGLTKGVLPWKFDREGNPHFIRGCQWLTSNPSFFQTWCLLGNLPHARNAWRITIAIPSNAERDLHNWMEFCRVKAPESAEEINRVSGDVENWFFYRGAIPTTWFVAIEPNHNERVVAEQKDVLR